MDPPNRNGLTLALDRCDNSPPMPHLNIRVDDPATARPLIEELDRYHMNLYPGESNHLLPIEALRQPNVTFVTAWLDEQLVGCGAVVNQGGVYAELKRMFVAPTFRGLKIGRRILETLETHARSAGLAIVRLETGIHQPEALRLYGRAGYQRRGPYGDYPEDPLSVYLEKHL